jgi:type I restriction enzyme M protein
MNYGEIVSFIWGVADLIRDAFKRGKYQDVILPLTVLRRLDCVLAPNKEEVLKRKAELRGKGLQDLEAQLRKVSGFAFYNTSRYDFDNSPFFFVLLTRAWNRQKTPASRAQAA